MATPNKKTKVNHIGRPVDDYKGGKSTLCAGCGHDSISRHVVTACYDLGLEPQGIVKLSGIGCSSKTPAYFLGKTHSFNSVHGRMPAMATGAFFANHKLKVIGVSGDGDTASIGMGQFIHMLRRNLPMVYIVENNGVYGLTKGQFSATADQGSKLKKGDVNQYVGIDLCSLAIQLGASFVARSFSGDKAQMDAIMKAALAHKGLAVLDIISPCVTFNNHEGSTRNYDEVKERDHEVHTIDFVPHFEELSVEYDEGTTAQVKLHDGSHIILRKTDMDYDPTNPMGANQIILEANKRSELLTGILYVNPEQATLDELENMVDVPLSSLDDSRTRPSEDILKEINASYS